MTAEKDFDLDDYLTKCRWVYAYYSQGDVWFPDRKPRVRITDMDAVWRLNCTRFLERRAESIAHRYTFGEVSSMSRATAREVIGEVDGEPVFGREFSHFDLMGERATDAFQAEQDARAADPVAWLRTTPLYRALAAGLPTKRKKLEALSERAKHWSTCPARESVDAECRCEEARAAHAAEVAS